MRTPMPPSLVRIRVRLSRPARERHQGSRGSCPTEDRYKANPAVPIPGPLRKEAA